MATTNDNSGQSNWNSPATLALLGAAAGMLDPRGGMSAGFHNAMQGMAAGNQFTQQRANAEMMKRKLSRQVQIEDYMRGLSEKHGTNTQGMLQDMVGSGIPEVMTRASKIVSGLGGQTIQSRDAGGNGVYKMVNKLGQVTDTGASLGPEKLMQVNEGNQISFRDPYTAASVGSVRAGISPGQSAQLAQSQNQFNMSHALARQNSDLQRAKMMQPEYRDGYFITKPNANNPEGVITPTNFSTAPKGSQEEKNRLKVKVTQILGDDTEDLIKQSTSSYAGQARDFAGRVIGMSTEPSKAASVLSMRAANLAGSMPRFEGPQSDADRNYYLQMAGDLANPSKTVEEKLAAYNELKKMYSLVGDNGSVDASSLRGGSGDGFTIRKLP